MDYTKIKTFCSSEHTIHGERIKLLQRDNFWISYHHQEKKNIQCNFKIGIKTYKERKRSIAKSLVSMKMCFMWLVITEMKIIVQSDAITYQNNYNWKQKQNNNDSLRWKFSYTAGESVNQYSPWNLFTVHTKTKHVHTVWPSSSIARHVSNGMMCIYRWKNIYVCTCS